MIPKGPWRSGSPGDIKSITFSIPRPPQRVTQKWRVWRWNLPSPLPQDSNEHTPHTHLWHSQTWKSFSLPFYGILLKFTSSNTLLKFFFMTIPSISLLLLAICGQHLLLDNAQAHLPTAWNHWWIQGWNLWIPSQSDGITSSWGSPSWAHNLWRRTPWLGRASQLV